jgi:hypothetical protein
MKKTKNEKSTKKVEKLNDKLFNKAAKRVNELTKKKKQEALEKETPRKGFLSVELLAYKSHTDIKVELDGITQSEIVDIFIDMIKRANKDQKLKEKTTKKTASKSKK